MRRVLLVLVALAGLAGLMGAEPAPRSDADALPAIARGPVPEWVVPLTWEPPGAGSPPGAPAEVLLNDAQSRLTPEGSDYYVNRVIRLLNAAGVRENSRQSVEYSPDYEHVTWHTLRLVRGGEVIDRLPAAQFKRLQRETELENQILTGLITAAAVIEDVRVGDVLEVAYTFHTANPVLRGQMSARHYLGSAYPTRRQTVRVLTPAAEPEPMWSYFIPPGTQGMPGDLFRHAALRSALEDESTPTERIYRWEAKAIPAIPFDAGIPGRVYPYFPLLRCGNLRSWGAVADWAEPLFASAGALPESAEKLVAQWKKEFSRPADRLRAAVHWVQDDVRYFSMAIGEHNLRPRPLAEVCASRFGDCKDKSVLLATMLRQLGFEAWPALVNTYLQDRIEEYGPSPLVFNHAIVAYRFDGELRWLDPTLKHQQGAPGRWAVPPYRRALIIRPDETALSVIPPDGSAEPDTATKDTIAIDAATGEATLTTEVTLRDLQADFYRQRLEAMTPEEMGRHWFNFIGRFYKKVEEVEAPAVQDDTANNRLVMRARYRIPGFLATEGGETVIATYAYALRALLDPPESRRRRWPYALPADRFLRHRIEVELPVEYAFDQQPQAILTEGVEYRVEKGLTGKRFVAVHDLRFTGDLVAADRMGGFCDAVDEILMAMSTALRRPVAAPAALPLPATAAAEKAAGAP
jgi:transglutaminase-like putative cysteine protease